MSDSNSTASQELFFLYELAKVLASSIDLPEVTEYVLDGTCALLGAEQGFIYFLATKDTPSQQVCRGLLPDDLTLLAEQMRLALSERRAVAIDHPHSTEGAVLAAPLVAHGKPLGLIGVASVYTRRFTPQEAERLLSVANLAALALENASLHDRAQRELILLKQLIHAAQSIEAGEMTKEQAAELEKLMGYDELGHLGQAFGRMAKQVIQREETLKRQVEELRIQVDEVKKSRLVAEITETEYFQDLRKRARELRGRG